MHTAVVDAHSDALHRAVTNNSLEAMKRHAHTTKSNSFDGAMLLGCLSLDFSCWHCTRDKDVCGASKNDGRGMLHLCASVYHIIQPSCICV
jgi:hypothetical protein